MECVGMMGQPRWVPGLCTSEGPAQHSAPPPKTCSLPIPATCRSCRPRSRANTTLEEENWASVEVLIVPGKFDHYPSQVNVGKNELII